MIIIGMGDVYSLFLMGDDLARLLCMYDYGDDYSGTYEFCWR